MGCVSRDSPSEQAYLQTEGRKLGSNRPIHKSVNLTSAQRKARRDFCNEKDAPAEWRGAWRKYVHVQECCESYFYSHIAINAASAHISKYPEEREFVAHQCTR